jgi:hypothetical protein
MARAPGWSLAPALLAYLALAALLIAARPGLQYDEALFQHGAVQMLRSPDEPTFAHDRGSWVRLAGRHWPLMKLPYAGAAKDYLLLAPFALFGPIPEVARAVAALLAAFGVWGIGKLLAERLGEGVGTAVVLVLAIHPGLLGWTVYDNGAVALWMASCGWIGLALGRHLRAASRGTAFWLGLACGFALWGRANFLWLLAAAAAALLIVCGRGLLSQRRFVLSFLAGGMLGSLPLLIYEIASRGGTIWFLRHMKVSLPIQKLMAYRWRIFGDSLLYDGVQRGIWAGPPLPGWQRTFLLLGFAVTLLVCLWPAREPSEEEGRWRRGAALTFLIVTAVTLSSRLNVAPHHLVVLLPVAVLSAVLALRRLAERRRIFRLVAGMVFLLYAGIALSWDLRAARGVGRTGGVGTWSDAIFEVARYCGREYPDREIGILDWGFQNGLFVLSNGRIRSRELFWEVGPPGGGPLGRLWSEQIVPGRVFLASAPAVRQFPATEGFLAALSRSPLPRRRVSFRQRNGTPYAEIIEIGGPVGKP